jgi:hypothetical protein
MKISAKLSLASMAPIGLGVILACSGSDSSPQQPATKLVYTNDPTAGHNDYRLETMDGSGTRTVTLVLRGPSSVSACGMNFALHLDQSKVKFVQQDGNDYARPGTVFNLGSTTPKIFRAVLDGENLRVSMAQKGSTVSAQILDGDIATVSVQLQSGAGKGAVALDHIGAKVLLANGDRETVQEVKIGKLEAQ